MIGRLRGVLVSRRPAGVVVEVGGVGYEILVAPRTLAVLPGMGEEVVVHTHLHGREDGITLYGFATEADRDLFRVLLTASGVGPKLGLAMLGTLSSDELRRVVATEDVDALTMVPGVGKRSAQKLLLDLRPKLADAEAAVLEGTGAPAQLRQALESLGYTGAEIRDVVTMIDPEADLSDQVRAALRELGRK
jgi:holliday junction DNA helicase RuvA